MPAVGKPVPHESAVGHVTGSAIFVDDIPPREDELVVGFVGSPIAHGQLQTVDVSRARSEPGIVGVFTSADIPGENLFGPVQRDEPFLAQQELLYLHQPIAVVAGEHQRAVDRARQLVHIVARSEPPILEIEEALRQQAFLGPPRQIKRGDVDAALAAAAHRLHGEFRCGGQEHLYLESQVALAFPDERGQVIVYSSTQNPSEIQKVVAEMLGLGQHRVVCVCPRMGGGFGGKETQAALPALMVALVAAKTNRPARIALGKADDMHLTGKRHPYLVRWQCGIDQQGRIQALRVDLHSDGGAAADLSNNVLERSMLHAENAYYIPNIEINGRVCFTNRPPNTAFRGFGGPQAIAAIECVMQRIAEHLRHDAYDIRMQNVYQADRNVTPYGQVVRHNHLPEIMATLAAQAQYKRRLMEVERFNAKSGTQLRGIALTPVKFGISFTTRFMNQANAVVHLFDDGTVQVSSGGTEMGQGLNTKLQQLVADELGVEPCDVRVMATSTEKNHNTSPTAASASTDLNGAAAVRACRRIRRRLCTLAARLLASPADGLAESPEHIVLTDGIVFDSRRPAERITLKQLARHARLQRVDLGARGFYATPGIDFNRQTGRGNPFLYYTQGAAVSEVLIDRLLGDVRLVRADLLIDIGRSINPGVDLGQIRGGFIQGLGWVTTEALRYDASGQLLSHSPTTYKIPAVTDVPEEFDVQLFDSRDHVGTPRASKAVGEPPLMLGISAWAAVRHAVWCAAGGQPFDLQLPATGEEVLRRLSQLDSAAVSR